MKKAWNLIRILWKQLFSRKSEQFDPELVEYAKQAVNVVRVIRSWVQSPIFDFVTEITNTQVDDKALEITRSVLDNLWFIIQPTPEISQALSLKPMPDKEKPKLIDWQVELALQQAQKELLSRYAFEKFGDLTDSQKNELIQFVQNNPNTSNTNV